MHLYSMRLINVQAFLEREESIRQGKRIDRRVKVLEFSDDEVAEYAILSHRWIEQEVDYNEVVELAKMDEGRSEIRRRDGHRKILQSCERSMKDGYRWLWVDTCCIDKRSSAELSEAINPMYRWYENSSICYAYLHDVYGSSFPTAGDAESKGWPEWFSRGWTLQEMIAPRDVQFFNRDWHPIGDKRTLAPILEDITRVPQHILKEGLSSNRPCVAQIMSWAANRTTTRVEDRAYSLMGLLDVNMPMLYGEGKMAFHRLQLEIIQSSNDQSIFAWDYYTGDVRTGSILADDPSFFRYCGEMELMNRGKFIESLKEHIPEEELPLIEDDQFGSFPITNRGIQIWLFLRPRVNSDSVFQALLPCRSRPSGPPVAITLALWESNYYRYSWSLIISPKWGRLQLRQVYLRYHDTPHCNSIVEIDNSALRKDDFVSSHSWPTWPKDIFTGNMVTLSTTDPLCYNHYICRRGTYEFVVGFGQCFGQNWIHSITASSKEAFGYHQDCHDELQAKAPERAQSMKRACSGAASCWVCDMETPLPRSTWVLQTSCVKWQRSRRCGVELEVFQDPSFGNVSDEWIGFAVEVDSFSYRQADFHLIGHCSYREQTIPTMTGGVS